MISVYQVSDVPSILGTGTIHAFYDPCGAFSISSSTGVRLSLKVLLFYTWVTFAGMFLSVPPPMGLLSPASYVYRNTSRLDATPLRQHSECDNATMVSNVSLKATKWLDASPP